ncbi:MAG: hypothetical protein GX130_00885 [Candidatus Hydrogenedens sp.]|jgi:hypothetical protein|nr:hypothetical protein [Candidatus Hydrogenedens sp.]
MSAKTLFFSAIFASLALLALAGCPPNAFYVLTVTSVPIEGGVVELSPERPSYFAGTTVTLTAIPSEGYSFRRWVGSGINTTVNPTDKKIYADEAVAAEFQYDALEPAEGEPDIGNDQVNFVKDGNFEYPSAETSWEALSLTGLPIICTTGTCGLLGGRGPAHGQGWAWFGNSAQYGFEQATLVQQIVLPAQKKATLSFNVSVPLTTNPFTFNVSINNTLLWQLTETEALGYNAYQNIELDIDEFASGRPAILSFSFSCAGEIGQESAVFIDDIRAY